MTPKEILIEARRLLVEEGWCKKTLGGDGGPRCMLGAIYAGDDGGVAYTGAHNAVIGLLPSECRFSLAYWNDMQDSVEPVLAKFDEAIALLE